MRDAQKKGIPMGTGARRFHVVRGGLYGMPEPRRLSPDEWLEREVRSLFASWKADNGQGPYASRGIANAAQSINYPHRIIARRMREAREAHVRHELVRQLGELLSRYADKLYAVDQQHHPDPDPVAGAIRLPRAA